jgi:diaminohydroxyphosphoribosylaminopyrimidine deaminase/5-amino-6-(5-phosphoribosylamino)uracil reductase
MSFEPLQVDWNKSGSYWLDLLASVPRDELSTCIQLPAQGTKLTDDAAMFLACSAALAGAGAVAPNPLVGAVLLASDGGFISAGAHLKIGSAHAEVNAVEGARSTADLEGASLFVTLEPCAHEGKTPSCAKMIAGTGISRVVYGLVDPNPKVAGQGVAILRAAGKKVESIDSWKKSCEWLARVFLHNQRHAEIFTAM